MKKIIMLSLSILLIYGCSPNNENNDANIPPVPTNLTAQVISFTQINLSWVRNSTDYLQLNIERKTLTGTYEVIADIPSWDTTTTTFSDYGYGSPFTPNTTYVYRVCYVNPDGSNSAYSNECTVTTSIYPTITTTIPTLITANTASSGGIITDVNGLTISERGVVWRRINYSSLEGKTIDGGGAGAFTSNVTELGENITYYLRAYIKIPNYGEIYGNEIAFTTLNYQTQNITICNQIWMQKNLNTSHYRNGDVIPQVTDQAQWENSTSGAWCYYNNDPAMGAVYGKLYNWYAVTDPRGLAPTGYHVPSNTECSNFSSLDCNGFNSDITFGGKLKEVGTTHWISPNTGATNETGFTGLPGGQRGNAGPNFPGFQKLGTKGIFWMSTGCSSYPVSTFNFNNYSVDYGITCQQNSSKNSGYSVRCIKN